MVTITSNIQYNNSSIIHAPMFLARSLNWKIYYCALAAFISVTSAMDCSPLYQRVYHVISYYIVLLYLPRSPRLVLLPVLQVSKSSISILPGRLPPSLLPNAGNKKIAKSHECIQRGSNPRVLVCTRDLKSHALDHSAIDAIKSLSIFKQY
jgi:hypothetical protein